MLILINLAFGFASGGSIDNAAHIGGLVTGLWLGALILPTGVPTLSSLWHRPAAGPTPGPTPAIGQPGGPAYMSAIGIGVVAIVVAAGVALGTADRQARRGEIEPGIAHAAHAATLSLPAGSSAARR